MFISIEKKTTKKQNNLRNPSPNEDIKQENWKFKISDSKVNILKYVIHHQANVVDIS